MLVQQVFISSTRISLQVFLLCRIVPSTVFNPFTPVLPNAGVWAPALGVRVPLLAIRHAYIMTHRMDGLRSPADGRVLVPNIHDHNASASVYLRVQSDSFAIGGYEPNRIFCDHNHVRCRWFSNCVCEPRELEHYNVN